MRQECSEASCSFARAAMQAPRISCFQTLIFSVRFTRFFPKPLCPCPHRSVGPFEGPRLMNYYSGQWPSGCPWLVQKETSDKQGSQKRHLRAPCGEKLDKRARPGTLFSTYWFLSLMSMRIIGKPNLATSVQFISHTGDNKNGTARQRPVGSFVLISSSSSLPLYDRGGRPRRRRRRRRRS